jgi:SAM-dependent methyltransferase
VPSVPDPHDPGLYARSFADVYDAWYGDLDDPTILVDAFGERCAAGAAIVELGGGTGRLAAPLQRAGFRVVSVDASTAMLRETDRAVTCVASDMAALGLRSGCADAVLIAYNTLFNLASRSAQQRCLAEVVRVLRPAGLLAIEAFVAPSAAPTDATGDAAVTAAAYGISVRNHPTDATGSLAIVTAPDPDEADVIIGSHVELLPDRTTVRPWRLVYQSPDELDLCADAAGLGLVDRFADWHGTAWAVSGDRHVSWYRRA